MNDLKVPNLIEIRDFKKFSVHLFIFFFFAIIFPWAGALPSLEQFWIPFPKG
jgi:hypothetical protein